MSNFNVKFYEAEFKKAVGDSLQAMLNKAALEIEGQAKINIQDNKQVDTAFMVNSVYTSTSEAPSHVPPTEQEKYSKKEKRTVKRSAAPPVLAQKGGAVVGVAAEYALYKEAEQSFLYKAAEQVASSKGGEIVEAGKEAFK